MPFKSPVAEALPRHSLVIGGERSEGGGGATIRHINPGTGDATREIVSATSMRRCARPAPRSRRGRRCPGTSGAISCSGLPR